MDRLLTILRAAHCRSTHHFFAIDALKLVKSERGQLLRDLVLRHYERYLAGAKDPDTLFHDFHNHVIHVREGYWGGATKAAELWSERFQEYLAAGNASDAAHALGVLSHYFTDPFQPMHTGQSEIESVLHRPIEWSICCAYESIYQASQAEDIRVTFDLGQEPDWLPRAILRGAELGNRHYETLLQNYNLEIGVKDPPAGLNDTSRDLLAEIFAVVIIGWAKVIERLAEQATCSIPHQSLSLPTLIAGLKMPVAWIARRIESKSERTAVEALFAEFQLTGTVVRNLPNEVRQVNSVLRSEQSPIVPHNQETLPPATIKFPAPRLRPDSPLVDAPSIGSKTANRFELLGIETVAAFITADPAKLAKQLNTDWINAELLHEWQTQARLLCDVPLIKCLDAQLLVGAGVRSCKALQQCNAASLARDIERFALTSTGKRYLRSGKLPDVEKISAWIAAVTNDSKTAAKAA